MHFIWIVFAEIYNILKEPRRPIEGVDSKRLKVAKEGKGRGQREKDGGGWCWAPKRDFQHMSRAFLNQKPRSRNKIFLLPCIEVIMLIHDRCEINPIISHSHIGWPQNYHRLTIILLSDRTHISSSDKLFLNN